MSKNINKETYVAWLEYRREVSYKELYQCDFYNYHKVVTYMFVYTYVLLQYA